LIQPWVLVAGLGVALLSSVIPYSLDLEALRKIPPCVFGIRIGGRHTRSPPRRLIADNGLA